MKSKRKFFDKPLYVNSGAAYPISFDKMEALEFEGRFGVAVDLYKPVGSPPKVMLVPRALAPEPDPDNDYRDSGQKVEFNSNLQTRGPKQEQFLTEAGTLLAKGMSFIIEGSTGVGKTALSTDLAAFVGARFAVVVHKSDLANQWRKAFKEILGLKDSEIGLVKGDICNTKNKKAIICFVQSLAKENRYPAGFLTGVGLVIFDEVHIMGCPEFSKAIWNLNAKIRLGLSATVDRKDGADYVFKSHIGETLVKVEHIAMVPKVLVKETGWRMLRRKVTQKDGSYIEEKLKVKAGRTMHIEKAMAGSTKRNKIIADYASTAYEKGRNTVILATTVAHLETLDLLLRNRGVKSKDVGYFIGGLTEEQQDIAKAKKVVLATHKMCSTGTDAPWWDFMIMATPRADVRQTVGRVVRSHKDKPTPVIVDLLDSDAPTYQSYYMERRRYYRKIKAEIIKV